MSRKVVAALALAIAIVLPAAPALASSCPVGSACGEPMPKDPQPSPSAEATEEPEAEPSPEPTPVSSEEPSEAPVPETDPVTAPEVEVGPNPSQSEDSSRPDRPAVNGNNQGSGNGGSNGSRNPSVSSGGYVPVASYVPASSPSSTKNKKERGKRSADRREVVPTPAQPAVTEPEESGPPWFVWIALVLVAAYGLFYFWRTRRENPDDSESEVEGAEGSDSAADDTEHARA